MVHHVGVTRAQRLRTLKPGHCIRAQWSRARPVKKSISASVKHASILADAKTSEWWWSDERQGYASFPLFLHMLLLHDNKFWRWHSLVSLHCPLNSSTPVHFVLKISIPSKSTLYAFPQSSSIKYARRRPISWQVHILILLESWWY